MKRDTLLPLILPITLILIFLLACSNPFLGDQNLAPGKNQHQLPELPIYDTVVPPQNLSATKGKLDNIALEWSFVPMAVSYNLYRSTEKEHGYFLLQTKLSTLTFVDDGTFSTLKSGIVYYYKVAAVNKDGVESNLSDSIEGYCYLSNGAITAPTLFTASNGDYPNQIVLKWDKVQNSFGYHLQRATSLEGEYQTLSNNLSKETTSYIDTDGLEEGKSYFYRIQTFGETEHSPFSSPAEGSLADATIPVAHSLQASTTIQEFIQLDWVCDGCDSFTILRSEQAEGEFTAIATVQESTYQDPLENLHVQEKPYFYRIQGFKMGKKGASSEVVQGHIIIKQPQISLKDKEGNLVGDHHVVYCDLNKNEFYNEADFGWYAEDNVDGNLSAYCYSEGGVDSEVPGLYTITYKVADKAGNKATATRIVKVGRSPLVANALAVSKKYPEVGKPFQLLFSGVTPTDANEAIGETIQIVASYQAPSKPEAVSVTVNNGSYTILHHKEETIITTLTLSNEFGSLSLSKEIRIYPNLDSFHNDFTNGFGSMIADVAIAIVPKIGFMVKKGLTTDYAYGGASYTPEQILQVAEGTFIMNNTEFNTNFWGAGDKKETCIQLRTADIHLYAGVTYHVSADITRSTKAKADVTLSLGGQSVVAPIEAKTHHLTLSFTPTEDTISPLTIVKGIWKKDISQEDVVSKGDQIEVRVDNIVLSYAP